MSDENELLDAVTGLFKQGLIQVDPNSPEGEPRFDITEAGWELLIGRAS